MGILDTADKSGNPTGENAEREESQGGADRRAAHAVPSCIRNAAPGDLDRILSIYETAKKYMRDNGNPNQWNSGYPERELLERDIEKGQLYVIEDGQGIRGVFAFVLGDDPTYAYIEDGAWPNDSPYGTIHRLAGDGRGGIFKECLQFCKEKAAQIRADTHQDNHMMRHLLEQYGFSRCGRIYLKNGSPRIAYQLEGF